MAEDTPIHFRKSPTSRMATHLCVTWKEASSSDLPRSKPERMILNCAVERELNWMISHSVIHVTANALWNGDDACPMITNGYHKRSGGSRFIKCRQKTRCWTFDTSRCVRVPTHKPQGDITVGWSTIRRFQNIYRVKHSGNHLEMFPMNFIKNL